MHPFGGTQLCPRCAKAVYAAEQVMGPGRKLYHKPCLACTSCNKRLDSLTLLEHNQQPYCKPCHLKSFGTRDLRHANLPYAPPPDNPSSPTRPAAAPLPRLKPNRSLVTSPISPTFPRSASPTKKEVEEIEEEGDVFPEPSYPSNTGRPGIGTIPRTVPLYLNNGSSASRHNPSHSLDTPIYADANRRNDNLTREDGDDVTPPASQPLARSFTTDNVYTPQQPDLFPLIQTSPLKRTATGTRYGNVLGGGVGVHTTGGGLGSPRKWGGGTPQCGRCGKSVFFAEQVKAIGKTFHKPCLRCTECGTTLDSNKLRDHDGDPFCVRCYSKLHGPQGGGYALLGKAGG